MQRVTGVGGAMVVLLSTVLLMGPTAVTAADGLYITNGTDILFMRDGQNPTSVHKQNAGRIVGLAFDYADSKLFWSDIDIIGRGIYSADVESDGSLTNVNHIISTDILEPNGLTVDWVSNHIYWTDGQKRSIELADYDGTNRKVLGIRGLFIPRGIVMDPIGMWLYWNDQGSKKIERARPDGLGRETLVDSDIEWPNQMVYSDSKLYFVDANDKTLRSWTSGSSTDTIKDLSSQTGSDNVFGLAINGNDAYISVWNRGQILKTTKNGGSVEAVQRSLGTDAMFSLAYYAPQQAGSHSCGGSSHGCGALCLPTGPEASQKRCACPSFGGKVLKGTQCSEPTEIVLYCAADDGEVAFYAIGADNTDRYLVQRSLRPVAVHYDPTKKTVYWSDVHERTIHSAQLDGTDHKVFLSYNHSLGIVDGLVVDPEQGRLYYSNMGFVEVESTTYSWHKIESVSLTKPDQDRRTIVESAERPRGLSIHNGYLYYTDWGSQASVSRVNLDGAGLKVVQAGLDNPNGVYAMDGRVYAVDSHYKTRKDANEGYPGDARNGSLLRYAGSSYDLTLESLTGGKKLITPFGVSGDYDKTLYVSDWGLGGIVKMTTDSQGQVTTTTQIMSDISSPMGVLYTQVSKSVTVRCSANQCPSDEVCLLTRPASNTPTCECNSYDSKVKDGNVCKFPTNFLLFSDMNAIKLVGLDGTDHSTYTIVQGGGYFSNFAGLTYNPSTKDVFFSDVNRRAIFKYNLESGSYQTFYEVNAIIDGMVIGGNRLYWTDYLNGQIASIDLSGVNTTYQVEKRDLKQPRAIAYNNGKLYWTEWGSPARVASGTPGTPSTSELVQGLEWPNALFIANNKMYIGDGKTKKIITCGLNGQDCDELPMISRTPEHIYSIWVQGNFLYYSDWEAGTINVALKDSGLQDMVIEDLMRPTQLYLQYSKTPACPSSSTHGCSGTCVALPGSYKCTCTAGQLLKADGKTCETAPYPWVERDPSLCGTCGSNAKCAQQVSSANYECQCEAGYEKPLSKCQKCPSDKYKASLGAANCVACPGGTSSTNNRTACSCTGGQYWDWKTKACRAASASKSGSCPNKDLFYTNCNSRETCANEGDCRGAQKCCDYSTCGKKCLDAVGLPQCIHNGKVYQVGDSFKPNACTQCQCEYDHSFGDPRFGGAVCEIQDCPRLGCTADQQIKPNGACCPICKPDGTGLSITNCRPPTGSHQYYTDSQSLVDKENYLDPFVPDVRDKTGRPFTTTRTPSGKLFYWKGQDVKQKVRIRATARNTATGRDDEAVCEYVVVVNDFSKPTLECPAAQKHYTMQDSTEAWWPSPKSDDNLGAPTVECEPRWGTSMKTGTTTTVICTATDKAANTKQCSFTVTVEKLDLKQSCSEVPEILNGNLDCRTEGSDDVCDLTCDDGYIPGKDMPMNYRCSGGTWAPEYNENNKAKIRSLSCIRQKKFKLEAHLLLKYLGCQPNINLQYTADLLTNLIQRYTQDYTQITSKVTVTGCDNSRRKKRQEDTIDIDIQLETEYTDDADRDRKINEINNILENIKRDIENGALNVEIQGPNGPKDAGDATSVKVEAPQAGRCSAGEITSPDGCLVCPAGTYQKVNVCELCKADTYQTQEGQVECMDCPGKTPKSSQGSYAVQQCEGGSDDNTTLIIAVVVAIVAVVLIAIIIAVVVIICKRRKQNNESSNGLDNGHTGPMGTENKIYASNAAYDGDYDEIPANEAEKQNNYDKPDLEKMTVNHEYDKLA